MADVQRQPEEVSEIAGHTQEHSEDEVADQRAVVFVDVGGEDAALGAHDFTQQGIEGQALAQVEVVGAVVEKPAMMPEQNSHKPAIAAYHRVG